MRAVVPTAELRDAIGPVDGVEVEVWDGETPPPSGVGFVVPDYRSTLQVLRHLDELPEVQVVQTQLAGYDGQLELLPEGVTLCNARGVHDDATAEHAIGLALAVLRRVPEAVRGHGSWQKLQAGMRSLADSRVLILGYGSIGRAVAERLLPMQARITAVATSARPDAVVGEVLAVDDLPDLLPEQDVVIVLVPLGDATRGLVGEDFLSRLPDGALVVNVARGGVLDTDAVVRHASRLRFALDVTDPEPLPDGHPLWDAPGILITPHVAGGTTAMLPRVAALVRSQLVRWVDGESLANVVSP